MWVWVCACAPRRTHESFTYFNFYYCYYYVHYSFMLRVQKSGHSFVVFFLVSSKDTIAYKRGNGNFNDSKCVWRHRIFQQPKNSFPLCSHSKSWNTKNVSLRRPSRPPITDEWCDCKTFQFPRNTFGDVIEWKKTFNQSHAAVENNGQRRTVRNNERVRMMNMLKVMWRGNTKSVNKKGVRLMFSSVW